MYTYILPRLVDILHVFCGFQKSLAERQYLKPIAITYQWLSTFFQWTATSIAHSQPHEVVDNSVNDSPYLRTQQLCFCHRTHLGKERPALAFMCTFYYPAYMHLISRDGQFSPYLGTKFHTSHTANSTLEFLINWLLNVNVL